MPSPGHREDGAERVALLLRVSPEEQRERETIEIQREFLQEYRRLYNLEVAQIYTDDGVSGTIPLHERLEARRIPEGAEEGGFSTLLVYRPDRLGRSLLVTVDAHERLEGYGVALRSATEPVDTSAPLARENGTACWRTSRTDSAHRSFMRPRRCASSASTSQRRPAFPGCARSGNWSPLRVRLVASVPAGHLSTNNRKL